MKRKVADNESVVNPISELVAESKGVDELELPTIHNFIDIESVDSIIQNPGFNGEISFLYSGHQILIDCSESTTIVVTDCR